MAQVQLKKLVRAGLMLVGGATFGHIGAFAGSLLGGAVGGALGTFASGLGEQIIGLGLEHIRQLFQKDPNLSNIIQRALEKALSQLREQRQKEIGILPDEEGTCFKNWLNALRKGKAWSGEEAEKIGGSFLTASEQEEEQILWSSVEFWLRENAGVQVPEPLLRFLKERLPETLQSCLQREIAENQQVFNHVMLSLMTQILQIVRSLPEEVRRTLEPEIQKVSQQIERQQQQFFSEVLGELAGIEEQLKRMEKLLTERFGISHVATFLLRSTNQFIRDCSSKVFVGRKEAFGRLNRFLLGENGVAIVYAPAGFGKTTFLANWVFRLKVGEWRFDNSQVRVFHHFFNPNLQHSRPPSNAYAHLLAQISSATQKPISVPDRDDERHAALTTFFYDLTVPEGERWVIVLDGLDDAEREVLPFIPSKLPKGLFFVVSGRWDGEGELPSYLREWARFTEFIPLKALSEEEIQEWLRKAGDGELANLAENDDFVRMLREKTDGFPLFVRYLMDDLLQAVRDGKSPEQILEKTPSGFSKYVREQLQQLAKLVRNEKGVRDLFALLTVAKGALRQDEVEALTGLSVWELEGLPHQVTRWFSIGKTRPSAEMTTADMPTYAFAHPLLAEEFRKHLGREAKVMEEKLLEWCDGWREHPFPYILRHYADHLHERWQMTHAQSRVSHAQSFYSASCQLALDNEFAQTQTHHLPDEPNLPLKTVQLALNASIKLEDAPMMARLVIEHAKRAHGEEETPLQAWRKGHRERALKMAMEIVFERDHKLGTLWGLLLAWVAESEGERDWAKRCLDEVKKRWEGAKLTELEVWQKEMAAFLLGELWQVEGAIEMGGLVLDDEGKRELATIWASRGLFEPALEVAEGIRWAGERARALREIAEEMAKAGMKERVKEVFEQALKVAEGIEDANKRARALREIAEEMVKARMFEQALKVAEGIEWRRAWALREIAKEMVKAGMEEQAKEVFEKALEVAEGIEDANKRAEALIEIAKEMVKAGMEEPALEVAEGIRWAGERARALREIAEEMAKAGMKERVKEVFEQALEVAEGIENTIERALALIEIAKEMAKAGMFEQAKEAFEKALKVVEGIENTIERALALIEIAKEMAKAGMFEQAKEVFEKALKVVEGIKNTIEHALALIEIAKEMAKAGMFEQAKEVFEKALKVVEGIENTIERALALIEIAKEMARAGMFEQALKVAEGFEEKWQRALALIEIAKEMARAGMFEQALKVAEGFEEKWRRAEALIEIAKEMARAGMFEQALKVAEGFEWWAYDRALALIEIAKEMVKAGMFEQALKVAEGFEEKWRRAEALIEIAKGMAKAGMKEQAKEVFEKALEVAEGIEDANKRAEALIEIAKEMAKAGMEERAKEVFNQALKVAEGFEDIRERASALKEIAEGMAKVGRFEQALEVAEGIEDANKRARALREIAEEMAKAGIFEQALKVAEGFEDVFEDVNERARALREIAEEMARAGEAEGAVGIVERETGLRTKMLPSVLQALAERAREGDGKSKEGFLRLLPLCGWALELAYIACGLLASLYPEQGEAIAKVVSGE